MEVVSSFVHAAVEKVPAGNSGGLSRAAAMKNGQMVSMAVHGHTSGTANKQAPVRRI
jgi:hypothetical protein